MANRYQVAQKVRLATVTPHGFSVEDVTVTEVLDEEHYAVEAANGRRQEVDQRYMDDEGMDARGEG
jgi:hypothetical protein